MKISILIISKRKKSEDILIIIVMFDCKVLYNWKEVGSIFILNLTKSRIKNIYSLKFDWIQLYSLLIMLMMKCDDS